MEDADAGHAPGDAEVLHARVVGCGGVEDVVEVVRREVGVGGRIDDGEDEGGE